MQAFSGQTRSQQKNMLDCQQQVDLQEGDMVQESIQGGLQGGLDETRLSSLVESIAQLSSLYKRMGEMVVEQGTLLDRIDYNLDSTDQQVVKAQSQLQEANSAQESRLAPRLIRVLTLLILVTFSLLLLKMRNP